MTIEEKAERLRELAEEMAEVLRDGPEVCRVEVRLFDREVTKVEAQMARPHIGSLEVLGSAQISAPIYSDVLGAWHQYRCVNISGIEFWTNAEVPAPVEEVPA